jgi:hypothetical protein
MEQDGLHEFPCDKQLLKFNNVTKKGVNLKSTETQYLHYDRVSETCTLQFIIYQEDLEMQYNSINWTGYSHNNNSTDTDAKCSYTTNFSRIWMRRLGTNLERVNLISIHRSDTV